MKTSKISKGFTLIELLVVISIISLLASMTLSTLSKTKGKAQNACTVSNIKAYESAIFMYTTDNNDTFPPSNNSWVCLSPSVTSCGPGGNSVPYPPLNDALNKYISGMSGVCEETIDSNYVAGPFTGTKYINQSHRVCIEWALSGNNTSCGSHFYPTIAYPQTGGGIICVMTLKGTPNVSCVPPAP